MGARGIRSKFIDAACPNEDCEMYGRAGQGSIAGNGSCRTGSGRIQMYVCRSCGRWYSSRRNTAFFRSGTKNEKVVQGLNMQLECLGVRATARALKVHPGTVARWDRKAAEHSKKVEEAMLNGRWGASRRGRASAST